MGQAHRVDWSKIARVARRRFGIESFRPGQKETIEAVLDGRDALAVMPTGAGKSLCFMLPALFLRGPTVVVSPLLALMQDQQEKLKELALEVAKLDSTLTASEERELTEDIEQGEPEFIYLTPEQLEREERIEMLRQAKPALLVVDEAHCISQWGHDFRPAFLSIGAAAKALGRPPILALTATATSQVREDIVEQLGLRDPELVATGVVRENLVLEVLRTVNEDAKREALAELITRESGSGIVYTSTVRTAEELYLWLRERGLEVVRYHGKLRPNDREDIQRRFMANESRVVVATKAFGLGIDKPDLRFVVHYQFPDSIESYYQEAGRAGRDGESARATLLYRLEDRRVQSFFLGGKYPSAEQSRAFYEAVLRLQAERGRRAIPASALAEAAQVSLNRAKVLIAQLAGAGAIEKGPRGVRVLHKLSPEELDEYLSRYQERGSADRERLAAMMHYGQSVTCRWRTIAEYFGEPLDEDCGHCDVCLRGARGVLDEGSVSPGMDAELRSP